jgi:hypothetical protein
MDVLQKFSFKGTELGRTTAEVKITDCGVV